MVAYNQIILMGNLTREPDIRDIGTAGMKVARLSLCVNEKRKTQEGKLIDNPVFVDVEAWARLAEWCGKWLKKNSNIFVEGRLQMAQWEKDGVKHQKLKVRAQNIKFLPKQDWKKLGWKDKTSNPKNQELQPQVVESETFVPDEAEEVTQEEGFEEAMKGW